MKKLLASLLVSILAAGGFVFLDASIQSRVETLESEVSSLREMVSTTSAPSNEYNVGDEICCFPNSTFTLEYSEKTITITEFTARITQVISEHNSFEDYEYPYRGTATVKGIASASDAGKLIYFETDSNDNAVGMRTNVSGLINMDGSFQFDLPLWIIRSNAAFRLKSFRIIESGQDPVW